MQSAGRDYRSRSVPILLLLVVTAPTVCLLWFMGRAIDNERLAVRKTLEDACRNEILRLQTQFENEWRMRLETIDDRARRESPQALFAECVQKGWSDGAVFKGADGAAIYPNSPQFKEELQNQSSERKEAEREESEGNATAAAERYAEIAKASKDINESARAWQSAARCYIRGKRPQQAIEVIVGPLAEKRFRDALDRQGRLIVPNAQLLALHLLEGRPDEAKTFSEISDKLRQRLFDYSDSLLTSRQRLFLMEESLQAVPQKNELTRLMVAEHLAAEYLDHRVEPPKQTVFQSAGATDVWALSSLDRRTTLLVEANKIRDGFNQLAESSSLLKDVAVSIFAPNETAVQGDSFYSGEPGKLFPGWKIVATWKKGSGVDAIADRRIAIYRWTAALVVAAICALTLLVARFLRTQMRLTRLKNDLVAAVSHELKTPLSSTRLLVETLLDDESPDPRKTREYLQLIEKENLRLGRLIDNFLAFSRMERGKFAFEFRPTSLKDAAERAIEALRERLEQPGCHFESQMADVPLIDADADSLVSVVVNLLDNALKYTRDEKNIVLRVYAEGGRVCVCVRDDGIGLSRISTKKIFERFYQVDRRLSREAGGCGLGLSVVKYVVDAHGGTIEVVSRLGEGSEFTVLLPIRSKPNS